VGTRLVRSIAGLGSIGTLVMIGVISGLGGIDLARRVGVIAGLGGIDLPGYRVGMRSAPASHRCGGRDTGTDAAQRDHRRRDRDYLA
jgi:hypothetical protein